MDIEKELFEMNLFYLPKDLKSKVKKNLKGEKKEVKKRNNTEHNEQTKFFNYVKNKIADDIRYNLIFAIPNGAKRNVITGYNLKLEGVKSGVPDVFVPIANKFYHGLFIEMKVGNNKLSPHQQEFINNVQVQGYCCKVCYSSSEAIEVLESYLNN